MVNPRKLDEEVHRESITLTGRLEIATGRWPVAVALFSRALTERSFSTYRAS